MTKWSNTNFRSSLWFLTKSLKMKWVFQKKYFKSIYFKFSFTWKEHRYPRGWLKWLPKQKRLRWSQENWYSDFQAQQWKQWSILKNKSNYQFYFKRKVRTVAHLNFFVEYKYEEEIASKQEIKYFVFLRHQL